MEVVHPVWGLDDLTSNHTDEDEPMAPMKKIPRALALAALLTAPAVAHVQSGVYEAFDREEEALKHELLRLSLDHPVVAAGIVGCIDPAGSGTDEEWALSSAH